MALPFIALGLSAIGTGMQVAGSISQGKAAREAAEAQAKIAEETAVSVIRQGADDERILRQTATRQISSMRADYGASGVTSEGSVFDWISSSMEMAERDAQTIKANAADQARVIRMGGQLSLMQGVNAQKNYNLSAVGQGFSGAASTALIGNKTGVF